MRRLLAITEELEAPPARYRVAQFRPYLEEGGGTLEIIPWPRAGRDQRALLRHLGDWDGVVVQRRLPRLAAIAEMRRRARRLVFDFDDAVVYSDSARGKPRLLLDRWVRFRSLMRSCDAVTAGNRYLAEFACRYAPASRVCVVPTTVEASRYRAGGANSGAADVLGWIGARSTIPYLERLRRPLEALNSQRREMVVRVISDQRPELGTVRVEWNPWTAQSEVAQLRQIRVGLAPLPDDRWSRGKCALRLLQYLAAGVPAVASPVGTQAEITRQEAALEAQTESDWISAITLLLDDPERAGRCIAMGSRLIHERFSPERWAENLKKIWLGNQ